MSSITEPILLDSTGKEIVKAILETKNRDIATTENIGLVKPDGETITIDEDGTIHGAKGEDSTARKAIADNWQGKGYNLIPFPYFHDSRTISGITWTVNADGSVTANGKTESSVSLFYIFDIDKPSFLEKGKTYVISDGVADSNCAIQIQLRDATKTTITTIIDTGNGTLFTVPNETEYIRIMLWVRSGGTTVSNITFHPMLVKVADDGTYPTEYQRYAKGNVELTDTINNVISDAYNPSKTYAQGEYCIDNNTLWKSKVNNNTGNTPSEGSYWTVTSICNELIALWNK